MRQPDPAQLAEYQSLRAQLQDFEPALDAEDIDEWIVMAMQDHRICPTDLHVPDGQTLVQTVMARTSTETKIRALKALLA